MPKRVDAVPAVPDPWEPYMDGSIWEFNKSEWRDMPPFEPKLDRQGCVIGLNLFWRTVGDTYYVVFADSNAEGIAKLEPRRT